MTTAMFPRRHAMLRRARSITLSLVVIAGAGLLAAQPALAQRDPEYAHARAAGLVGEKPDGYLGFVTPPDPALRRLVENLNIKRRAVYAERARELGATIDEYALSTGCRLIAATEQGERYEAPDGTWRLRDATPPVRDHRCP